MCNLASSTDREFTKYEMKSAEIIFGNIESLLQLDLLKKTNADLIYKANMHHFKEVYRMTDNSDTPPDRTIWCFV